MSFWQSLKRLGHNWQRDRRTQRPQKFRRQLTLEYLEQRTVPTILFGYYPLTYTSDGGGPVINHAHVELVFWGPGWNVGSNPTLRANIQNAVDGILAGPYTSALSQYRSTIG